MAMCKSILFKSWFECFEVVFEESDETKPSSKILTEITIKYVYFQIDDSVYLREETAKMENSDQGYCWKHGRGIWAAIRRKFIRISRI